MTDAVEHNVADKGGGEGKIAAVVVLIVVVLAMVFLAKALIGGKQGNGIVHLNAKPEVQALTDPEQYSFMQIPAFALVDQDGNAVTNDILQGHYTVMEFGFSNCQLVCPIMKSNLLPAASALKSAPVRFLTFSVDPMHDTPEQLRAYADQLGIDTAQWSLLTGEPGAVRDVAQAMGFVPPAPDGKSTNLIDLGGGQTMENIVHPSRFIVLDPEGRVVGMYGGLNAAESEQMVRDLKAVMRK
ncbi:MAG: SCO family protein [Phycisphaerales bacterium]|nr:SCO family protein [Phycisphaerales bacterium]